MRIARDLLAAGNASIIRLRGSRHMEFPWLPLAFGLSLLALTLFVCRTINARRGVLRWNGARFFFMLCLLAMLLDFLLTMIFASANFPERTGYERFASRGAWSGRVVTYLIPLSMSLLLAVRFRGRQRLARALAQGGLPHKRRGSVQIQTSPYTESELPLYRHQE
jgi:hypothetical protein